MTPEFKDTAEATAVSKGATFWLDELQHAGRMERDWRSNASALVDRYRSEKNKGQIRLNIFTSNVETLKPRIYSQLPRPDVRRRNISEDPMTRDTGLRVATLLEGALNYALDAWVFDKSIKAARDDMLITGRGTARLDYKVDIVRRRDIQVVEPLPSLGGFPAKPITVYLLDGKVVEPEFDDKGPTSTRRATSEPMFATSSGPISG